MRPDSAGGQHQPVGDFRVGQSLLDEGGDLDLGRREAGPAGVRMAVECTCQPARKLHMTPKQIEDGPVICGLCHEPFEPPEQADAEEA